jgi:hypothetical protein
MSQHEPIATCKEQTCDGCDVANRVHCHFSLVDWFKFIVVAVPPIILGAVGMFGMGTGWGIGYLLVLVGFFGFLEIRVMCSHCPHYAEPGNTLRCWANYGSLKVWKYRPGPMSVIEHVLFLGGLTVVYLVPVIFMVIAGYWVLLAVDAAALVAAAMVLRSRYCIQCMNFACTLNRTPQDVREAFFEKHPSVAEAWSINQRER